MTQNPKTSLKKTNIPWIGEIPKDWEVLPIRWLFFETDLRSKSWEETLLSVSQYTWVTKREDNIDTEVDNITNASTLEWYKIVREKDLVINIMLAWNWSLAVSNYDGITSPAYATFQAKEDTHPEYFHYLLRTEMMKTEFKRFSTGIIDSRLRLYPDSFLRIYTIKPPLSTQSAIANFLDEKTSKISQFIENKKNLIELLKEQKQSIIHRAVTKGIDPIVKMKESGIQWIGEIPEGWDIVPFSKYFTSVIDYRWKTPEKVDFSDFILVTTRNIKDWIINYDLWLEYVSKDWYEESRSRWLPRKWDIIFTMEAPLWECAIVDNENVTFGQRIVKFRLNHRLIPEYAIYSMRSFFFQSILQVEATGSTVLGLKSSKIHKLKFILPRINDQKLIVHYIEKETSQIDRVIETIEREIALIEEYRTSLIYQAVTGKISIS